VDEDGEDVIELQNARTTVMGVGNYSVPIDIVKHLSVRSIEAFRPLSTMWHLANKIKRVRAVAEVRIEFIKLKLAGERVNCGICQASRLGRFMSY
jgi:hypothetical protein